MSNLVHVNPQALAPAAQHQKMTLADKLRYCEVLAEANMLPDTYRNNPGNVLVAVEFAGALNVDAIIMIMELYFVKNRPAMSAKMMNGLARRAGHKLAVDNDKTQATCVITRSDNGMVFRSTFTLEDAKTAKLIPADPRANWTCYPEAMMRARATSACIRMACPECCLGIMSLEELGSMPTDYQPEAQAVSLPTQDPGFKAISAPAPKPKAKKTEPKPEPVADTGAAECPDAVEAEVVISEPAQTQTVEAKAGEVFGAPAPESTPPPANTGQKAKLWREMRRVFGSKAESKGMDWLRAVCAVHKLAMQSNGMPDVDGLSKEAYEELQFALVDHEQSLKDAPPADDEMPC